MASTTIVAFIHGFDEGTVNVEIKNPDGTTSRRRLNMAHLCTRAGIDLDKVVVRITPDGAVFNQLPEPDPRNLSTILQDRGITKGEITITIKRGEICISPKKD